MGRSDSRRSLRRHFMVDAESIALTALTRLSRCGRFDAARLGDVVAELGIDPEKPSSLFA